MGVFIYSQKTLLNEISITTPVKFFNRSQSYAIDGKITSRSDKGKEI